MGHKKASTRSRAFSPFTARSGGGGNNPGESMAREHKNLCSGERVASLLRRCRRRRRRHRRRRRDASLLRALIICARARACEEATRSSAASRPICSAVSSDDKQRRQATRSNAALSPGERRKRAFGCTQARKFCLRSKRCSFSLHIRATFSTVYDHVNGAPLLVVQIRCCFNAVVVVDVVGGADRHAIVLLTCRAPPLIAALSVRAVRRRILADVTNRSRPFERS